MAWQRGSHFEPCDPPERDDGTCLIVSFAVDGVVLRHPDVRDWCVRPGSYEAGLRTKSGDGFVCWLEWRSDYWWPLLPGH
jgi:hypothetical protein